MLVGEGRHTTGGVEGSLAARARGLWRRESQDSQAELLRYLVIAGDWTEEQEIVYYVKGRCRGVA